MIITLISGSLCVEGIVMSKNVKCEDEYGSHSCEFQRGEVVPGGGGLRRDVRQKRNKNGGK